jgi:UDPglucose 6-dehydrogenase
MAAPAASFTRVPLDGMKICCLGAGYVGGPTMAMIAKKCPGVTVTVVDLWKERIDAWNSDELPIYEPGLDDLVKGARGRNLHFTTDAEGVIAEADIIFVSVNTPTKTFGIGAGHASNVKNVELAARMIGRVAKGPKIVVEKSTVPVKTGETLKRVLNVKGGFVHQVLSNPEFLAEGTAVRDLEAPSRVLIGGETTPEGLAAVGKLASVYAAWVPLDRIITTNLWSSELSKLVANAFLAQRISSINSISALCEATEADVDEVARAVGTDVRIGPHFLKASVGFGGSCFQKDILNLVYLCHSYGLTTVAEYWHSVVKLNDYQKTRFAEMMVARMFHTVAGKRIAVLGFAFKKDTGDVRESAAAYVVKTLLSEKADLWVYDPKVKSVAMLEELDYTCGVNETNTPDLHKLLHMADDVYEACAGAHAVAVMTEWDMFKTLDWARIHAGMAKPAFVFDGRNILNIPALRDIGFEVYAVGKPLRGDGVAAAGAGAAF